MSRLGWLLPYLLLFCVACPGGGGEDDGGTDGGSADAAVDAGSDGGDVDAGVDAGADAGSDGGLDGGADGGSDGGADGGPTVGGLPQSPLWGQLIFNEVLTDGTANGDPNGDGDANPVEDQFVELANVHTASVDLGDFTLVERDLVGSPRHTFATGTVLSPGQVIVVFGGGDAPAARPNASYLTANAADPGIPFGLHLSTPSDALFLLDPSGGVVAWFCYGEASGECSQVLAFDASLTRSPDVTGGFEPHATAAGSGGASFSPGTRLDGTDF